MTGRKGPSVGRIDILKTLLNYVISTFYPQVDSLSPEYTYVIWLMACSI
jgi:hypothetical protein